jgi:hypothetical protein
MDKLKLTRKEFLTAISQGRGIALQFLKSITPKTEKYDDLIEYACERFTNLNEQNEGVNERYYFEAARLSGQCKKITDGIRNFVKGVKDFSAYSRSWRSSDDLLRACAVLCLFAKEGEEKRRISEKREARDFEVNGKEGTRYISAKGDEKQPQCVSEKGEARDFEVNGIEGTLYISAKGDEKQPQCVSEKREARDFEVNGAIQSASSCFSLKEKEELKSELIGIFKRFYEMPDAENQYTTDGETYFKSLEECLANSAESRSINGAKGVENKDIDGAEGVKIVYSETDESVFARGLFHHISDISEEMFETVSNVVIDDALADADDFKIEDFFWRYGYYDNIKNAVDRLAKTDSRYQKIIDYVVALKKERENYAADWKKANQKEKESDAKKDGIKEVRDKEERELDAKIDDVEFLLNKIKHTKDRCLFEGLLMSICDSMKYTKKYSFDVLKALYERVYCSVCRGLVVELMIEGGVVTDEIITECAFDSCGDTRAAAKAFRDGKERTGKGEK